MEFVACMFLKGAATSREDGGVFFGGGWALLCFWLIPSLKVTETYRAVKQYRTFAYPSVILIHGTCASAAAACLHYVNCCGMVLL